MASSLGLGGPSPLPGPPLGGGPSPLSGGPPLSASLPPMSSFRGPSGGQSPAGILYPSHSPVVQTPGDTLGKALASVSIQCNIQRFSLYPMMVLCPNSVSVLYCNLNV